MWTWYLAEQRCDGDADVRRWKDLQRAKAQIDEILMEAPLSTLEDDGARGSSILIWLLAK